MRNQVNTAFVPLDETHTTNHRSSIIKKAKNMSRYFIIFKKWNKHV